MWLEFLLALVTLTAAVATRPWRLLASRKPLVHESHGAASPLWTPLLATLVFLPWMWALPTLHAMPLQLQWSGACLVVLMLGWPLAIPVLLAVGADYNLLLVSRIKEEIHAGLNTGIIRAMVGTGSVVTSAGLVFAFTMMSMSVSKLIIIGQVGTTIGLGLLFDTLVVRSLMTPSIASLLGRWFWWPQRVRQRPVPQPWPKPVQREAELTSA